MRILIVTFFLSFVLCSSLYTKEYTNELINETSPYLQQHAHNPVQWHIWSAKTFEKAVREHKPIFLSIGYSTCHWCHVMEKESFSNKKIANLLNKYFISIKVDREELPQIDAYFQNIYYKRYNKRAGWPLNIFMTPQKKVFYMSGYIPSESFDNQIGFDKLIFQLQQLYNNKTALHKAIKKFDKKEKASVSSSESFSLQTLVNSLVESYNKEYKGFGFSREFPLAKKTALLFDVGYLTHNKKLQKAYFDILDAMAMRGLYDHGDGGFFRYTVDGAWEIPHFEKMLYNQAELSELYTRAYLLSSKKLYRDVVYETLTMVKRHFRTKEGLFYSASDAQSDGVEGKYYTFSQKEMESLFTNKQYDEIEDALLFGNFHNRFHIAFDTKKRPKHYKDFQKELQKIRCSRNYPFIDKKINTAWNAMMIKALFKASVLNKVYKKDAQNSLDSLLKHMYKDGELYHQTLLPYIPKQKGILEDYAFLIAALLAGYETDYDKQKLLFARYLTVKAKQLFYNKGVWYLSREQEVPAQSSDKYYTSPASQMIQNIIHIAALQNSLKDEKFAKKSLQSYMRELREKQSDAPALAEAFLMLQKGVVVLKSSTENLLKNKSKIAKISYPYLLTKEKNQSAYLACTLRVCFAKEEDFEDIKEKIEAYRDNF